MSKYNIYTVEEAEKELRYIQRAIICNCLDESNVSFSNIDIKEFESEKAISDYLLNEISEKKTNLIIIDYKLNSKNKSFDGNLIFDNILEQVPFFPLLILTNRPEECANQFIVDPDKIYKKGELFDIESEISKRLVTKLFQNIDLYLKKLREFEEIEQELAKNLDKESSIKKIIECDEKMSKLIPGANTNVSRKFFNETFFEDLSNELQEAKEIINKYNDNK